MLYKKFYHKKIVAIGDVHGNIKTLEALLKKIPKGMEVFFLGDLIDRGPASKEVVSLVKNKYKCLLGNHESFMVVEGHRKLCRYTSRWGKNGAKQTKKSYGGDWKIKNIPNLKKDYQDHRLWMKELPLVAHFPKIEVNGRELFLSHSSMDLSLIHI